MLSQSCVSCGELWKYQTIFPVSGFSATTRAGEKIIAFAALAGADGVRISGGHIDQIEIGIVSGRLPRHAAAVLCVRIIIGPGIVARVAGLLRRGVPLPLQVAGFGIARFEKALHVERIAADADDDVIADDERRVGGKVVVLHVGDLFVPAFLAGSGIERDHDSYPAFP